MFSVYDKVMINKPICNVLYNVFCNYSLFILILPNRITMSRNIGDKNNLFLKIKTKLGLYEVVLKTSKPPPKKLTVTV